MAGVGRKQAVRPGFPRFEGRSGQAHHAGQDGLGTAFLRNFVGLVARRHLDAVFQVPQEEIGLVQVGRLAVGQVPLFRQRREHVSRAAFPGPTLGSAVHELEPLGDELDLPDAAPAQLDVIVPATPFEERPGDPLPHVVDVFQNQGLVEGGVEHKGLDRVEEPAAHLPAPRRASGLQERLALPGLSLDLVVPAVSLDRVGDVAGPSLRTQAQVDAEHLPVRREPADEVGDGPGELRVVLVGGRPVLLGAAVRGVVDVEQVDVRAEVEVPAAELAHADDGEAARLRSFEHRPAVPRLQFHAAHVVGGLQAEVGHVREPFQDRRRAGLPHQVADGDAQVGPLLERAQGFHGLVRR